MDTRKNQPGRKSEKSHVFNVLDFGASADGKSNDAKAFQHTIDACTQRGGGTVYVPPGQYMTGSIEIKSNVTFYVEAGAVITGSGKLEDYAGERGSLISAQNASNIAIRGRGRIDGNGMSFVKGRRDPSVRRGWRPGHMVTFRRCENVLMEDFTLTDSPSWTVHPIDCDRVTIRGISIINGITEQDHVPNSDGINPDGCTRVRISDCYVQSGDDSICLKNERPDGSGLCRDITVTNCVLVSTETALKIGSGSYGEFRNITFSNCVVRDAGCGVGLWMRDGGLIDGWTVDNIAMTLPNDGVPIYFWSWKRRDDTPWGTVRNVMVSNVTAIGDGCVFISGVREKPMEGITLENFRMFMRGGTRQKHHEDPPYPFQVWGHRRAPYDIYCRYVNDLKLRNIKVTWSTPEKPLWGSAIRCLSVKDLEISGFEGRQSLGSDAPAIHLTDVKGAFVHNCRAPRDTGTFLHLDEGTEAVTLMNNDLSRAERMVHIEPSVRDNELFESSNRPPGK